MPTYAYRCPQCGHTYEKLQKITDDTRAKCPECGTRGERVITGGAGLVFKGSGFYATDYKRSGTEPTEPSGGSDKESDSGPKPEKSKQPDKSAGADS
ncbi:MAG: zinc ribbon domain-containing protein [Gemmatimonadota bacterium]|nr:zinc ribbon domain-containing protein [Gemmatimonadota bacterium]MDH3479020.1 zinc ribbon domain-containing protein [Gemmatimonadota bacterium]MDH3570675.1 zinc ribbon domain-containing protein [Gemmatimonadota bacterium]MDH5549937.1 zinc ribbon domain-containing protein [Gemmatimonadota bacterium]